MNKITEDTKEIIGMLFFICGLVLFMTFPDKQVFNYTLFAIVIPYLVFVVYRILCDVLQK